MNKLNKEINEAIKNSLPEQVGVALRERIDQAERIEADNEGLNKTIEALEAKMVAVSGINAELSAQVSHLQDIKTREVVILEKERDYKVLVAEIKEEVALRRADDLFRLVDKVFSNPTLTTRRTGNKAVVVDGGNGLSGYTQTVPEDETTTETID